jgi:hypothetical protein
MKFYAYIGKAELGKESLGTFGRHLFELKTTKGAIRHCKNYFNGKDFRLYVYSNFFNNKTFKEVRVWI